MFLKRKFSKTRREMTIGLVQSFPFHFVNNIFAGPFLTAYLLYLGASSQQIGIILSIPPITGLFQIFIASYIHKFKNRKAAMTFFYGFSHVLLVVTGAIPHLFAKNLWILVFFFLYLFSFINFSAGTVFWSSLIGDIVPGKVRGRYFGIRNMIITSAAISAVLISGQIIDAFSESRGFSIVYWIGACFVTLGVIGLSFYPNLPFEPAKKEAKSAMLLKPFKDASFIKAAGFFAVWSLVQGIAVPMFAFVMLDILNISFVWVSVLTIIQMTTTMFSSYIWGNLNKKIPTPALLFWVLPIIAASCAAWGFLSAVPQLAVLVVVHFLLGIGNAGFNQLTFNFQLENTTQSDRPMYMAVFTSMLGIAGFIGPIFGGYLFRQISDMPFWVQSYGVFSLIGVLLLLMSLLFKKAIPAAKQTTAVNNRKLTKAV